MEEEMYDEFGNLIKKEDQEGDQIMGKEWVDQMNQLNIEGSLDRSDNEAEGDNEEPKVEEEQLHESLVQYQDVNDDPNENAIVLHEDKQYYPEAEEVYGNAETLVQEEDAIPITTPIIAPVKKYDFDAQEKEIPKTTFNFEFLGNLSSKPDRIRNLAVCGHLHHGKTLFMDMFVQETHTKSWDPAVEHKYTDTRKDEKERMLSIKSMPMSFIIQDSRDKSYLVNLVDTPGHPNFVDEVATSLRIADGVLLVVDVIEGVTLHCQNIIKHALEEELPIILVINKLDRLVLELKLPPSDAYLKIKRTIEKVNYAIKTYDFKQCMSGRLSPVLGNVIFASSLYSCAFTLKSFAALHLNLTSEGRSKVDPEQFSKFLWGDIWFNEETRKFAKKPADRDSERSFVSFLLEPFYKLVGYTVAEEKDKLQPLLNQLKIYLKKKEFNMDVKPLLKRVLSKRFGNLSCIMDSIAYYIPSAKENTPNKIRRHYLGDSTSELSQKYSLCSSKQPLLINIVKLYHKPDRSSFDAFGRIFSGSIKAGDTVKVILDDFDPDREDSRTYVHEVKTVNIYQSRYKISTNLACAGSWVLIEGVSDAIKRTATLVDAKEGSSETSLPMQPIQFRTEAVVKIACESCIPSEHPKMQEALSKISKSYPLAEIKTEDSGEHLILGTGELYLDCALHDLRNIYSEIEVKVSDPSVRFCETVVSTSSIISTCESSNKLNSIQMIAETLDDGLAEDIETKKLDITWPEADKRNFLVKEYEWDELTASSLWAFGPEVNGPNILVDYTLEDEVDKSLLNSTRNSIVNGFKWATSGGPLCEEPVRGCKFKILNAQFASEPVQRGGGSIIPIARNVVHSSFLTATPRLLEPLYIAEVTCPEDCIEHIYNILLRRRAHVVHQEPLEGSPLHYLHIEIPAIEIFGFETDLRTHTVGQAMVLSHFNKWALAPGDPLDRSIQIKVLEPSEVSSLAREFMIKTRRRKGMVDDVNVPKFFEHEETNAMARQDRDLQDYFIN